MLTADFSRGLPDLRSGVYRHYKEPLYLVLGYAHDANADALFTKTEGYEAQTFKCLNERAVVVYMGLELTDAHKGPRLAVRTAEDFFTLVGNKCGQDWSCSHHDCNPVSRFTYMDPVWYGQR